MPVKNRVANTKGGFAQTQQESMCSEEQSNYHEGWVHPNTAGEHVPVKNRVANTKGWFAQTQQESMCQ